MDYMKYLDELRAKAEKIADSLGIEDEKVNVKVDVEMIEKKQKEIIEKMKDELFHVAKEDVTGFAWLCKLYVDSIDRKLEKNECVNLLVNEISELGLSDKMKTEVKEYAEFCKKNDLHDDFINNLDKASDEALDLKKEEEERIKKMKKDELNSPSIRQKINGESKIDISKLMNRNGASKQNNNDNWFGMGR
jgi:hypothetical protein